MTTIAAIDWYKIIEILLPAIITAIFGIVTAVVSIWQIRVASRAAQQELSIQRQAAELNYRATVLSANRVRWIEEVRTLMAEVIGHSMHQLVLKKKGEPMPMESAQVVFSAIAKLGLLINENEPLAKAVTTEFTKLSAFVGSEDPDTSKIGEVAGNCARAGHAFLKAEWERVKKGV